MGEARPLKPTKHCRLAYNYMLASSPFLLAPGRPYPSSMRPHSIYVYAKTKTRTTDKQWKEKMQKAYEIGIKQISMIYMTSKETRKKANK